MRSPYDPESTHKYLFFIYLITRHRLLTRISTYRTILTNFTNRFVVKVVGLPPRSGPGHVRNEPTGLARYQRPRGTGCRAWRSAPLPVIGKMRVDRIRREDLLRILKPVWTVHPDVARKLRQRIRATLRWCQAHGHVEQNVAGEAIDGALPPMPAVRTHRKLLFLQHVGIGENTR